MFSPIPKTHDVSYYFSSDTVIEPAGPLSAKIAIVGMAPAEREIERRTPFVGKAGSILDACIDAAGLNRSDLYLTNILKQRPTNDNTDPFYNIKTRSPTNNYRQYAEFINIFDELNSLPELTTVVVCGDFPLYVLMEDNITKSGITKFRGSILTTPKLPGKKIIPIIHPSSVGYGNYLAQFWIRDDLKRAKKESTTRTVNLPKRTYRIDTPLNEAVEYLDKLIAHAHSVSDTSTDPSTWVSFDIETVNNTVSCIAFTNSPTYAMCIPVSRYTVQEEVVVWKKIAQLLGDQHIPKVGQNLIFDTGFLYQKLKIITRGPIYDTMVLHHLMYPDFPKGLDFLVSYHCGGEPYYKDEGKVWKEKEIVGDKWTTFQTYNCKDAALTLEVWLNIHQDAKDEGFWLTYLFTMGNLHPLNDAIARGIKIDYKTLHEEQEKVLKQQEQLQAELDGLVKEASDGKLTSLNPNSTPKMREYFYKVKKLPPFYVYDRKTKTNKLTLGDKNLQIFAKGTRSFPPVREAFLSQRIRAAKKLKGTYLDIKFDPDNRFRCSYDLRGTTTGRFSSRKTLAGTGMNYQNLPKAFKRFMVSDEGHIFIEFDKRQAEWVVVAYFCGDPNMIHIIENKLDAHVMTAKGITHLPVDFIKLENKYVGHSKDPNDIVKLRDKMFNENPEWNLTRLHKEHPGFFLPRSFSCRQVGKHSNHGLNYDQSPEGYAAHYEVPLEDAIMIYNGYHKNYANIKEGYGIVQEMLRKSRTLYNCFGRKRVFYKEMDEELFRSAYDFTPQSTVTDNVNYGMQRLYFHPERKTSFINKVRMVGETHDSYTIQFPYENLDELAKILWTCQELMNIKLNYFGREFTIFTDAKIGFNGKDMIEVDEPSSYEDLRDNIKGYLQKAIEANTATVKQGIELTDELLDELDNMRGQR